MHKCVFTSQKTKKSKKWIDGYIVKKERGIILYDEEKKQIYKSTAFKILEDSNIEVSMYLIYVEDLDEFLNENKEENSIKAQNLETNISTPKIKEEEEIKEKNNEKIKIGRSADDVLELFK